LAKQGDRWNAAHARHLLIRRLLLIGQVEEAEQRLSMLQPAVLPPALLATQEPVVAGIAIRRVRTRPARAALIRAAQAASQAAPNTKRLPT